MHIQNNTMHKQYAKHSMVRCWCDLCLICNMLIEVVLKSKFKFKLQMYSIWSKLHLLMFVNCNPCGHVCDMLLKYKWSCLHCIGSTWNEHRIKFELIPFKPNSKSYWSHLRSTKTKLKVGNLDRGFSPDHFSYITLCIWTYSLGDINIQSLGYFL